MIFIITLIPLSEVFSVVASTPTTTEVFFTFRIVLAIFVAPALLLLFVATCLLLLCLLICHRHNRSSLGTCLPSNVSQPQQHASSRVAPAVPLNAQQRQVSSSPRQRTSIAGASVTNITQQGQMRAFANTRTDAPANLMPPPYEQVVAALGTRFVQRQLQNTNQPSREADEVLRHAGPSNVRSAPVPRASPIVRSTSISIEELSTQPANYALKSTQRPIGAMAFGPVRAFSNVSRVLTEPIALGSFSNNGFVHSTEHFTENQAPADSSQKF